MSATVALRPARDDDLGRVHALIESAYRGNSARAGWTHEADLVEGARTSRDELALIVAAADQRLMLAEDDEGALNGCVHLSDRGGGVAYCGMLTVAPAQQASGLGRAMLAAVEREAVTLFSATMMELSAISRRHELIAWYERRGYRATGERRPFPIPLDPPLELLVLAKPIGK